MFVETSYVLIVLFYVNVVRNEDIRLPSFIMFNQSLSTVSPLYLCHLHRLDNVNDEYLQGYEIMNGGAAGHVHHLLVYECSTKEILHYSGLCGKDNAETMPTLVYHHCQTRIIIAWANGGERKYIYPKNVGLKFDRFTQLLLEVHFDPSLPSDNGKHSIGIHLDFYEKSQRPDHEIGVLTVGTLAHSPLFLPPHLEIIHFPTYCSRDCLTTFIANQSMIYVFALLVHAHQHAIRLTMKLNQSHLFFDRNPFEFHRQTMHYFSSPYPQIRSNDEISLICSYSTRNERDKPIRGGFHSNDEMCQAFLYYYPKISSFPLCLSLPIYSNISLPSIWTKKLSHQIKDQFESTRNHWMLCGDKTDENQTNLRVQIYQSSSTKIRFDERHFALETFAVSFVFLSLIFIGKKCLASTYSR